MPSGPQRDWLENDITGIGQAFADLIKCNYLRLRLNIVTTNACRKFHIDAIEARLVCTYRGLGTQYGTSKDRSIEPKRIQDVQTGSPFLMRGTLWPEEPRSNLLHRSPH